MKKQLCMLIVLTLIVSMLAGCGTKAAVGQPEQTAQTATEQASTPSAGQTEISLITWRAEDADVLKEMIADFESKNPDIKVNLEITSSDITEYYTVLKSRLIGGEGADVFMVHPGPYQKELAEAGYLKDLTGSALVDTLEPSILTAGQVGGKQYSLTETYNSFAIYYNEALFEQLGIEPPTDYASLVDACKKSVEGGYMPVAAGFGEAWVTEILYEALMCSYANGDDNVLHALETGEAKLTDEVYQHVFSDVADMIRDGIFQNSVTGTTYESSISLFASGRATMLLDGTWSIGNLLGMNEELRFGLARIPSVSGEAVSLVSPSQGICINANGSRQDEAERFVAYLFTVEAEEMYCNGTKQASTVAGTTLDVPEMDLVSGLMQGESAVWPDVYVENAQLMSILDDLCCRIAGGSVDVAEELARSQAEIEALLAD